jgi:hypothetical protein
MADFNVHYDPITVNSGDVTVDVKGLNDIKSAVTLATPQPLKLETDSGVKLDQSLKLDQTLKSESRLDTASKVELAITQPIKTESTAELDIKPLALDQCLRVSLGPLPQTCVRQPYQQRIGFTLFGVEIFGFNLSGESQVMVTDIPTKPHVALGGEQPIRHQPSPQRHDAPRHSDAERAPGGGLRIRLDE